MIQNDRYVLTNSSDTPYDFLPFDL